MPPVRVFDQLAEAMADLTMVYATTARDRNMVKPIVTARQAALEARVHLAAGGKVGFLFGPERTGLLSDDVSLANKLITVPLNGTRPATQAELQNFFAHLEGELDACGFLRNLEARPSMVRNLRSMWQRAELTEQEVRTLHGMIKELTTLRVSRRK